MADCRAKMSLAEMSEPDCLDRYCPWPKCPSRIAWACIVPGRNVRAELPGPVLSLAEMSRVGLSGPVLSLAEMSKVGLSGPVLSLAEMSRVRLSGPVLSPAEMSRVGLSGPVLSLAEMSRVGLSGPVLSLAEMSETNVRGRCVRGRVVGSRSAQPQGISVEDNWHYMITKRTGLDGLHVLSFPLS